MKFQSTALILLCANWHSYAEPHSAMHTVLISDLRWYFHWFTKQPIPADTILCRGQRIGNTGRIYCSPGAIQIQLSWDEDNIVSTKVIKETLLTYGEEMAESKRLNDGVVRTTFSERIAASEITDYRVDLEISAEWIQRTHVYMEKIAKLYNRPGEKVALYYPKVGMNDPFYHVYLTIGSQVDSIWQFEIVNGQLEDFAHWTFDRPHKSVLDVAQQFISDPRRWLRIVQPESGVR